MLRHREREKLINAIVFFARNAQAVGKVKLFKLLYLLDFEHFKQTGRTVTGLEYQAWELGPVPPSLMQQWGDFEPDLAGAIAIEPVRVIDYVRSAVKPRVDFDESAFSKRELSIMEDLVRRYGEVYSPHLIDVTHEENGAWARVWNEGEGRNRPIPTELALSEDDPNRDAILESAYDYQAIREAERQALQ